MTIATLCDLGGRNQYLFLVRVSHFQKFISVLQKRLKKIEQVVSTLHVHCLTNQLLHGPSLNPFFLGGGGGETAFHTVMTALNLLEGTSNGSKFGVKR